MQAALLRGACGALLLATTALWVSLLYLLQIEVRNRLAGSPGESSPLYLALLGLPVVVLATAACVAASLAAHSGRAAAERRRGLGTAAVLLLVAGVGLLAVPSYGRAVQQFATLPWRALLAG